MNSFKILFSLTLMMGTITTTSASSWLVAWLGLEVNLLSILPLMKKNNKFSSETMIKYFITQALASMILIASIMLISSKIQELSSNMKLMEMTLSSALLLKLGAAPLHFWFPEVMSGLTWTMSLVMMTWQKIAPSILLSYTNPPMNMIMSVVILSTAIGSIQGLNQTCLRKLLAYSSINNLGWMIPLIFLSLNSWTLYLLIYSIINLSIIQPLKSLKIFFISQMNNLSNSNKEMKLFFSLALLSLGGLPPFIGFLPKWLVIDSMTSKSMFLVPTLMIIFTLIALFMYMRLAFSSMTIATSESVKICNKMMFSSASILSITGLSLSFVLF